MARYSVDIHANVTGFEELDAIEKQIKNIQSIAKTPINIKLDIDGKNTDILKQMTTLGKNASTAFTKGFNINKSNIDDFTNLKKNLVDEINSLQKEIQKSLKNNHGLNVDIADQIIDEKSVEKWANEFVNKQKQAYEKAQKEASKQQIKDIDNQKSLLQKIDNEVNNGLFDYRSTKNRSFLDKYVGQDGDTLKRARQQIETINQLQKKLQEGTLTDSDKIDTYKQLNSEVEKLSYSMKQVGIEYTKTLAPGVASESANKVKAYYESNSKAINKYGTDLKKLEESYRNITTLEEKLKLDKQFSGLKSKISAEGLTGKSTRDELKRAFGQIAEFAGIYGAIQNVIYEVPRQMAQNVLEVDKAMTTLQMATGVSNDKAQELMGTYSELGDQLKATGTDVAASATEWLKQGKSIAESQKLAKDSIVLSKIGDLSAEESTKTITAAMKSYDLDESEVMNFIDKISAIDMASATDVGGLADAFNKVAANARNAGIETEKVLAYAATIGETTQEGMDSVGTSLNSIFSRMGNIKLSRLKDPESGEDLSNVETSLKNVGISLRESTGEFRDFDEVIDETASRWDSFSEVTQRSIASSFAGTHHMNEFLVLMQNYSKAQEYMQIATNSSGESLKKYEAYTDSAAGKLEGFANSFQSLSTVAIDSDIFKGVIDSGTALLNILTQIIDIGGGIPAVLGTIAGVKLFKNLD